MKATDMSAYARIFEKFKTKEYTLGNVSDIPIYTYRGHSGNLTVGHFVNGIQYSDISFKDVPKEFRTREFFIHTLCGCYKDVLAYVKEHIGEIFDREFFKDLIATNRNALEFKDNCFSYMPLEYIDEEMVFCAMIQAIDSNTIDRRGDYSEWFYSVIHRKPEVLNQDLYTLAARCFARDEKFIDITPEAYKTNEYYFALCVMSARGIMNYIPDSVVTTDFLVRLINDSPMNIRSFSEAALEKTTRFIGSNEDIKFWQAAMKLDGYVAQYIPLNDERVKFFFELYDKSTGEYRQGFKRNYKDYVRKKADQNTTNSAPSRDTEVAIITTLIGAASGDSMDNVIDGANSNMRSKTDRTAVLPITYLGVIPKEFIKKYDSEEYIAEIYKKLGIEILGEKDSYYYSVILPDTLSIEGDGGLYFLKDGSKKLLAYLDVGPFYDRSVYVNEINVTL